MLPQEKAKELVDKFVKTLESRNVESPYEAAKQCALIAVDEIIKAVESIFGNKVYYWRKVKQEIKKV